MWSARNLKRILGYENFYERDFEYYDDFLPLIKEVDFLKEEEAEARFEKFNYFRSLNDTLREWVSKKLPTSKTMDYIEKVAERHLDLIEKYTSSIEFTHVLEVPPDFYIETNLQNIHVWLLLNRLADFPDNATAKTLATILEKNFKARVETSINKLHIGGKMNFIADTNYYLETTRHVLSYHFKENPETLHDPVVKADALVWSNVFFEKVGRYDKGVYLISAYLLEAYKTARRLSLSDILSHNVNFSAFAVPIDFEDSIKESNPALTESELIKEEEKEEGQRRHRYDYPMERESLRFGKETSVLDRRIDKFERQLHYVFRKYNFLDVYDNYCEREERSAEAKRRRDKYAWADEEIKGKNNERELLDKEGVMELREKVRTQRN